MISRGGSSAPCFTPPDPTLQAWVPEQSAVLCPLETPGAPPLGLSSTPVLSQTLVTLLPSGYLPATSCLVSIQSWKAGLLLVSVY